jgi:Mrp family chromosome partitioning ATPase
MLSAPLSADAEPYRFLRASLDVNNSKLQAKTIIVTSAMDGEGKTTTAANLAIALARSGRDVILADFDLRRPRAQHLFDLDGSPGLAEISDGRATLDEALLSVWFARDETPARGKGRSSRGTGKLAVLTAGLAPPDPDTLASDATASIVESLRERADVVVIDVAPLLPVGDAIALSSVVDAIVLVVRRDIRSSTLDSVSRVLSSFPVPTIGFVVTGAEWGEAFELYRYPPTRREQPRAVEESGPRMAPTPTPQVSGKPPRHIVPVPHTGDTPPPRHATLSKPKAKPGRWTPHGDVLHEANEP